MASNQTGKRPPSSIKLYYETPEDLDDRRVACALYTNNVSILRNDNYNRTVHKINKEKNKIDQKHSHNALIWQEQWFQKRI